MEIQSQSPVEYQRKVIFRLLQLLKKERQEKGSINVLLQQIINIAKRKQKNVVFNLNVFQPPNPPDDNDSDSDEESDHDDIEIEMEDEAVL